MYEYVKSEPYLWTVGYTRPDTGEWEPDSDHKYTSDAAGQVQYLNGDNGNDFVYLCSEPGLFTVGSFCTNGIFHPYADTPDRDEATRIVHGLNTGG